MCPHLHCAAPLLPGTGKSIGTTKRGIGPAYSSKATRNGLRVADLMRPDTFADKLRKLAADGKARFGEDFDYDLEGDLAAYPSYAERLAPFITDTVDYVNEAHEQVRGANVGKLGARYQGARVG